jgi:hypothetical protein
MSILIQGPKKSGIDMHLYLGLLKEELAMLWEMPAHTWDAYTSDYFDMRAALLTTVHNYPGYGYVACQVNHGFCACVRCMDKTRIYSCRGIPGLRKPCSRGLECGSAWITRGENAGTYSMAKTSSIMPDDR